LARTRAEDYDDKRGLIFERPAELFAESGFARHYFPSKEAILHDVLRDHVAPEQLASSRPTCSWAASTRAPAGIIAARVHGLRCAPQRRYPGDSELPSGLADVRRKLASAA
jgi:hypothetical protein